MTTVFAWAVGAALVVAGLAILRARQGRGAGSEMIRVVTSRYLGGKRFLTIVEVEGERLLLGLAGDRVSLVARLGTGAGGERA